MGRVLAGTPISYEFVVQNSSAEAIKILSDVDIGLNCGCSSLVPTNRRIEPGNQTHVKAKVETHGKHGPFAHGGTIVWTSVSGSKRLISFVLRGEAVLPIESIPEEIRFDATATRKGEIKEFLLTANVSVEWGSLKWSSPSPYFQILEWRIEGGSVRCKAKCVLPEGQESLQGMLTGSVAVRGMSSPFYHFVVPFLAEQTVELVIVPRTVPIMFHGNDEKGKARLLLHGELLGHDGPCIREIRCDGFRVHWSTSKPTPSKKEVLEITFEPTTKYSKSATKLQIELVTGKTVVLPIVHVRSTVDRRVAAL